MKLPALVNITKWTHKLGKSKKELGILTPKRPRERKCGCTYKYNLQDKEWNLDHYCYLHEVFGKIKKGGRK